MALPGPPPDTDISSTMSHALTTGMIPSTDFILKVLNSIDSDDLIYNIMKELKVEKFYKSLKPKFHELKTEILNCPKQDTKFIMFIDNCSVSQSVVDRLKNKEFEFLVDLANGDVEYDNDFFNNCPKPFYKNPHFLLKDTIYSELTKINKNILIDCLIYQTLIKLDKQLLINCA